MLASTSGKTDLLYYSFQHRVHVIHSTNSCTRHHLEAYCKILEKWNTVSFHTASWLQIARFIAHGYRKLPLHESFQEMTSVQTIIGFYTPTRLLQRGTDSGNNFQVVTQAVFEQHLTKILQWMDDFLLHTPTEQHLLDDVETFLKLYMKKRFKICAEKSYFSSRKHLSAVASYHLPVWDANLETWAQYAKFDSLIMEIKYNSFFAQPIGCETPSQPIPKSPFPSMIWSSTFTKLSGVVPIYPYAFSTLQRNGVAYILPF